MPARKRKSTETKSNQQLNLINPDITQTTMSQLEKVLEGVADSDRATVIQETQAVLAARGDSGMSTLAIGEHLERVREILEPQEKFITYLKALPNFSQATAYRMIWTWRNAQKVLPTVTLRVAMVGGFNRIISNEKDGGWAKPYQQAVKNLTERLGKPPDDDTTAAHNWLMELMKEKRTVNKTAARAAPARSTLEINVVKQFVRTLKRVPMNEQPEFIQHVVGYILKMTGFPYYKAKPATSVPAELLEVPKREPQRAVA